MLNVIAFNKEFLSQELLVPKRGHLITSKDVGGCCFGKASYPRDIDNRDSGDLVGGLLGGTVKRDGFGSLAASIPAPSVQGIQTFMH